MSLRNYLRSGYRAAIQLTQARSRYRFFMTTSFTDLDARIRQLALATDHLSRMVRPVLVEPPFGRSMLVVAPHQDDELVGCGGTLLRHVAAGGTARVVFVSDGGGEHEEDGLARHESVAIREAEARKVAKAIGIEPPRFLAYESLRWQSVAAVAESLRAEIDSSRPDSLFVPFFLDTSEEHRVVSLAVAEALAGIDRRMRVYSYEVWGLCVPNTAVRIDPVVERRNELLALYESQLSGTDYITSTTGLNMYRSRAFGAGTCRYVEAFMEMPSSDYIEIVRQVLVPR